MVKLVKKLLLSLDQNHFMENLKSKSKNHRLLNRTWITRLLYNLHIKVEAVYGPSINLHSNDDSQR